MEEPQTFVKERLESLHRIDLDIVSLLSSASNLFAITVDGEESSADAKRDAFSKHTLAIYETLGKVAKNLRTEVKIMDDNIGVHDQNKDGVMILPITVDQKNTRLGFEKLRQEIDEMNKLLQEDTEKIPNEEQAVLEEDNQDAPMLD